MDVMHIWSETMLDLNEGNIVSRVHERRREDDKFSCFMVGVGEREIDNCRDAQ